MTIHIVLSAGGLGTWTFPLSIFGCERSHSRGPGRFRARGTATTLVGITLPPLGPSLRGGASWATVTAVAATGGGTVITTMVVVRATSDSPHRSGRVIR